jgi:radical SAM superfamily enzyme YgiQ (UPF0313 family)
VARVLLVNGPFHARGIPTIFPIHLAALGSCLVARGHEVRVVDLNVEPPAALDALLDRSRFDRVGIAWRNVLPFYWADRFRGLRRLVRRVADAGFDPIVGGPGFSLFAPVVFRHVPELSLGVLGEGEDALARIVAGEAPADVPGVVRRTGGDVLSNYPPRFLPGEEIPAFRDLPGLRYDHPAYLVGLQSYRGCPHSCAYCPVKFLRGDAVRLRPEEAVRADLEFLAARGVRHVFLIDGVSHYPPERHERVLDRIRETPGIDSWEGFLKPGPEVTDAHLRAVARAKAVRFHVDVITASPRLAAMVGHQVDLGDSLRVARRMRAVGLEGVFYFAYELPTQTLREEIAGLRAMRTIRGAGLTTYVYPFFPFPGTGFDRLLGDVLARPVLWQIARLVKMVLRPSFFRFLRDMTALDESTGPRKAPVTSGGEGAAGAPGAGPAAW